jgi:F-type H+-transporting ATPase subunit epsilon
MIRFKLITLTGVKFDEDVYEVLLPTLDGEIGVLTDHMPLTSVATIGVISVRKNAKDNDQKLEHFACGGGIIEVRNNVLKAIVSEADNASEINEKEARDAYELAQKMKHSAKDSVQIEEASNLVDILAIKIKVAEMRRQQNRR